MEKIIDSADSIYIEQNIASAKSNPWVASNLSTDLHFGDSGVTMDNPFLVFQRFHNIIENHLMKITVEEKYFYRPELLAKNVYGSSDLWWLVLISSGIIKHQNFNRKRIKIFNPADLAILDAIRESTIDEQTKTIEIKDLTIYPVRIH